MFFDVSPLVIIFLVTRSICACIFLSTRVKQEKKCKTQGVLKMWIYSLFRFHLDRFIRVLPYFQFLITCHFLPSIVIILLINKSIIKCCAINFSSKGGNSNSPNFIQKFRKLRKRNTKKNVETRFRIF